MARGVAKSLAAAALALTAQVPAQAALLETAGLLARRDARPLARQDVPVAAPPAALAQTLEAWPVVYASVEQAWKWVKEYAKNETKKKIEDWIENLDVEGSVEASEQTLVTKSGRGGDKDPARQHQEPLCNRTDWFIDKVVEDICSPLPKLVKTVVSKFLKIGWRAMKSAMKQVMARALETKSGGGGDKGGGFENARQLEEMKNASSELTDFGRDRVRTLVEDQVRKTLAQDPDFLETVENVQCEVATQDRTCLNQTQDSVPAQVVTENNAALLETAGARTRGLLARRGGPVAAPPAALAQTLETKYGEGFEEAQQQAKAFLWEAQGAQQQVNKLLEDESEKTGELQDQQQTQGTHGEDFSQVQKVPEKKDEDKKEEPQESFLPSQAGGQDPGFKSEDFSFSPVGGFQERKDEDKKEEAQEHVLLSQVGGQGLDEGEDFSQVEKAQEKKDEDKKEEAQQNVLLSQVEEQGPVEKVQEKDEGKAQDNTAGADV